MSLEDPFFVVKEYAINCTAHILMQLSNLLPIPFPSSLCHCSEVFKALNKTRGLYLRWRELGESGGAEVEWTTTELRNSLRSIEWDLEDLEDTINILFELQLYSNSFQLNS